MRGLTHSLLAGFAVACLCVTNACAQSTQVPDRFVLTGREAVLPTQPVVVSDGVVTDARWSGDGRYVLAIRTRFPPFPLSSAERPDYGLSVVLWDRETQRSRTVWQATGLLEKPEFQIRWVGQGPIALGTVDTWVQPALPPGRQDGPAAQLVRQRWLARLDARAGTFRLVSEVAPNSQFHLSPTRPVALLYTDRTANEFVRFARADGSVGALVAVPLSAGLTIENPTWTAEGDAVLLGRLPPRVGGRRGKPQWYAIDPANGGSRSLPERPEVPRETDAGKEPADVKLAQRPDALGSTKPPVRVRSLWLEATDGKPEDSRTRALLAVNAEWGKFSPTGDAVLYVSEGTAWICSLRRLPREEFLAAWKVARREQLRDNAMQLGNGAMMYAQDHDETLPGAGDDIQALLNPYLKDSALFDGFVYTYPGGRIADIDEPAKAILGYTPVDGGQIILYVDGHNSFQPNR